jgi:hypothetical protein
VSFTSELLAGLAEYLDEQGVGDYIDDTSRAYPLDATAIVIRTMMPEQPDRVISLDAYTVSDDTGSPDSTVGVQLLTRAGEDPFDVEDLDDALFNALHGAKYLRLRGIVVVQAYRRSSAPLGQDGAARYQSTNNYYLDVKRPSRHRSDLT